MALMLWAHQAFERIAPDLEAKFAATGEKPTLLEVGGGPAVMHLLSASKHVGNITFTDHMPVCLHAVEKWVHESEGAFDWGPYATFVADMEHESGSDKVEPTSILNRLRNKIHRCLPSAATPTVTGPSNARQTHPRPTAVQNRSCRRVVPAVRTAGADGAL